MVQNKALRLLWIISLAAPVASCGGGSSAGTASQAIPGNGVVSEQDTQKLGETVDADNNPFRLYGCLCYESLASSKMLDFNVTAEPWGSWESPLLVVSSRVRDVYREHGLEGWIFEPVLEKGTGMFEAHQSLWKNFIDQGDYSGGIRRPGSG